MVWVLLSEEPVGFEFRQFDGTLFGDTAVKIEHSFEGASFPGIGYAVLSNVFAEDTRETFYRSYPYKDAARIYRFTVPPQLTEESWLTHHLQIKCNQWAKVQADANWKVKAWAWY